MAAPTIVTIPPPAPIPNEADEPASLLEADRPFLHFLWQGYKLVYAELTITNNQSVPLSYKAHSMPDPPNMDEDDEFNEHDDDRVQMFFVARNAKGFLLPGEAVKIFFSMWEAKMPQHPHHFVIRHKVCTEAQCSERGALRELWGDEQPGDGLFKIPVAVESDAVQIEGGHRVSTVVGHARPITYIDAPAKIENKPGEQPFTLRTTTGDCIRFHWHIDAAAVFKYWIRNTSAVVQAYRVLNPNESVYSIPENEMGFLVPRQQQKVVIQLRPCEDIPDEPTADCFVVQHVACTREETTTRPAIARQFWRGVKVPDGVKRLGVVVVSDTRQTRE